MKRILCLLLAAVLLCGCTYFSPNPTKPSEHTDESTVPSTVPKETAPTEQASSIVDIDAWKQYSHQPETYRLIRGYDPESSYDYPGKGFDRSQMVKDRWYILDDGEIIPMAVQFSVWHVSSEHLYYTLLDQPRTVYRSNLHMEETTVIYQSEYGDIGFIQFSGFDANGQLVLLEGKDHIIFYDIPTGSVELALEASEITWVYAYTPTDVLHEGWESQTYNPTIQWRGSMDGIIYSDYCYYLENGINEKF